MTTIRFSDVDISTEKSNDMQPVELETEISVETEEYVPPNQSIPEKWRSLLEAEGADIAGIEWWEAPSFIYTVGKQGFSRPMIIATLFLIGLPILFILSFPLNLLVAGIYTDQFLTFAILGPVFFSFGVILCIFFLLYITFLSETSFSVGGLGRYFYAATPRSLIIGYRALPLPLLSSRLPTSVTTIPYQAKYFRGDIRWDGSGGLLLPSANMTVEQKKQCLGGKGGFLYVRNMQVLLSYIHSVSSGVSDSVPEKVTYGTNYARINVLFGVFFLLCYLIFTIITVVVLPVGYIFSFQTFGLYFLALGIFCLYYGFHWFKHAGVIHLNSPPNPKQTPEPLPVILFRKFRHAIHR